MQILGSCSFQMSSHLDRLWSNFSLFRVLRMLYISKLTDKVSNMQGVNRAVIGFVVNDTGVVKMSFK